MASKQSPFPIRMMYATSRELMEYAARIGCNWVVTASTGHKTVKRPLEDPEVYLPQYEKLAPHREARREQIEAHRRARRAVMRAARQRGMKNIYCTYEPSLPAGFQEAYPRLFVKRGNPYLAKPPADVADQREVCVTRPEVREALAAKVEEICQTYRDLDGFMFLNNECSTLGQVWHRCERCMDVPFAEMMKHLHDAMAEGVRRSGRDIQLMNRCWGTHEAPQRYGKSYQQRVDFGLAELPGKQWLADYATLRRGPKAVFSPKRDIPAYLRRLGADDRTVFVYKATWADTNLRHPLNPWMGRYHPHAEVAEFSFEHCGSETGTFYIMGREMQRRARLCRDKGVAGICCVPVSWGVQDNRPIGCHPSKWSLNELNIFLLGALMHDPDADLVRVTRDWLRQRYGRALPVELAEMLLDSEDIAAEAMNLGGIRATGQGMAEFYSDLLRYAWMFPDWQQRTARTRANLKRIFDAKDRNVRRARRMLERIDQLEPKLPPGAHAEFRDRFNALLRMAERYQARHKLYMTLWAIKDGKLPPTAATLEQITDDARALARA